MKNLIALILTLFTGDAFASSISLNEILENQDTIVVEPILYKGLPVQESNRFGVGGSAEQICKAAGYTTVREKKVKELRLEEREEYIVPTFSSFETYEADRATTIKQLVSVTCGR